jgi:hypothetical protein
LNIGNGRKWDSIVEKLTSEVEDGWRYVWFSVFEAFFLAASFVLTFCFVADNVEAAIFTFSCVGWTFDAGVVFFSTTGKRKGAVAYMDTWKCGDDGCKHDKSRDEVLVKHGEV